MVEAYSRAYDRVQIKNGIVVKKKKKKKKTDIASTTYRIPMHRVQGARPIRGILATIHAQG